MVNGFLRNIKKLIRKTTMKKITVVTVIFIFGFIGCSSNPIDEFLDEYENVVEKWESKANSSTITFNDINELNQATLKFSEKAEELKETYEFSSNQLDRYIELTSRLSNAFLKISKNKPSFGF
ncbi:MAG: hypothetical protein QXG00_07705 [Candidatus Woesearchaeota archaeon]